MTPKQVEPSSSSFSYQTTIPWHLRKSASSPRSTILILTGWVVYAWMSLRVRWQEPSFGQTIADHYRQLVAGSSNSNNTPLDPGATWRSQSWWPSCQRRCPKMEGGPKCRNTNRAGMDNAVCEGLDGISETRLFPSNNRDKRVTLNYTHFVQWYSCEMARTTGLSSRVVCREEKKACMLMKCIDELRTRSINTSPLNYNRQTSSIFTTNKSLVHCSLVQLNFQRPFAIDIVNSTSNFMHYWKPLPVLSMCSKSLP
jgi:hypothetical protein